MPFDYRNGLSLTQPPADDRTLIPTTPTTQPLPGITRDRFSLIQFRSPLLPESLLFSLPTGTEMFHFPAFPPHTLYIQVQVTAHNDCRVSPFGHPRIKARLTTPRGLSRPPTSFIGSWYQGIHRAPLKTWPQMLASTVQFSNNNQPQKTGPRKRPTGHSLTTQQRAPHHPPTDPAFHTPKGSTHQARKQTIRNSQRSTHEQTIPGHSPRTGISSLERR
jgi:hypothetical protein